MTLEDIDRHNKEVLHILEHHGAELLGGSWLQQLLLAISAGSFITMAAALAPVLSAGVEAHGPSKFLQGFAFTCGFFMVILSGSALFTEINVVVPRFLLKHWRYTLGPTLIFWGTVWIGNLTGALFTATLINLSAVFRGDTVPMLEEIMDFKMYSFLQAQAQDTTGAYCKAWFQVACSGLLGNWLVGMVAFFSSQARTINSKIWGVFIPVLTFTALGVQHSTANMGLLINGLIYDGMYGFSTPLHYSWGQVFAYNIIPASIGNIVGGFILVVLLFSFALRGKKPGDSKSWFFREPVQMRCAACDAANGKEMSATVSHPVPPPQVHKFSQITLCEDFGETIQEADEPQDTVAFATSRRAHSQAQMSFGNLVVPDEDQPVRATQLASVARDFAYQHQITQEFEHTSTEL